MQIFLELFDSKKKDVGKQCSAAGRGSKFHIKFMIVIYDSSYPVRVRNEKTKEHVN